MAENIQLPRDIMWHAFNARTIIRTTKGSNSKLKLRSSESENFSNGRVRVSKLCLIFANNYGNYNFLITQGVLESTRWFFWIRRNDFGT